MSKIEWTDRSDWNPVRGCTRVSEGCRHCYAEQIAGRFSKPGLAFEGFATRKGDEARWTGRVALQADRVTLPLRWRKPAKIFVNSMFDLFHEDLPDEDIDRVFAVMALARHHTFQVLTKRTDRMRAYFEGFWGQRVTILLNELKPSSLWNGNVYQAGLEIDKNSYIPNVWLGASVEDQTAADERIPALLATPAAVLWLSCEPMLGPLDLTVIRFRHKETFLTGRSNVLSAVMGRPLDWIVAGGESGRGARSINPDWVRSLRDQCANHGVPFFFKQWGGPKRTAAGHLLDCVEHHAFPVVSL